MKPALPDFANLLIVKIAKLFKNDLALQNDFLRLENKILRSKLAKRQSQDPRQDKKAQP
jgi:regulator of replication initiation timing